MTTASRSRRTAGRTSGTSSEAPPEVVVEAIGGPGAGARLVLGAGIASIGSAAGCDLRLTDPAVSRQHASIELRGGGVRVRDLGSRNGTRYLGAKVTDARVPVGGSIEVGKTVLRISPRAAAAVPDTRAALHGLLGASAPMQQLYALVERLAPSEASVLIQGETGSGKDAAARALHAQSARAAGPFVVFDCATVSPALFESELFGHAKGAFTGALKDRAGAFELAHRGTLFLDEVAELPAELQPKLLRALESGELRRVGENRLRKVSVRVVSATHQHLEGAVKRGTFRADLFFRIVAAVVEVPPLRERREDIEVLARHFAREASGLEVALSPATLAALRCDDWPGNVRELRNAVNRALALGPASRPAETPRAVAPSFKEARDALLQQFEHDYLVALLARHAGNLSAAARSAGLARSYFYELLARHRLAPPKP
ncbi:MAG: sigma 54-dependent Fis family transcriptional regulator [Archangiaceae bacterium]|nr:sigma 54-dependent Fis family transcriptional regulator [Archangiaceae bacterium]